MVEKRVKNSIERTKKTRIFLTILFYLPNINIKKENLNVLVLYKKE
jgi:hypothetical protein